jgi:hypothetical protein
MSDFNWCHGPYCHQNKTVDRIRGVKGSKVLRTKKIPINTWNRETIWKLFCSQSCLMNFVHKHYREMIALEPRFEPLETPIEDPKKETQTSSYGHTWNNWTIKEVDNA